MRWMINPPYSWMRRTTVHAAALHDTSVLGCVWFDTVFNPASLLARLQECWDHFASSHLSVPQTEQPRVTCSSVCAVHSWPKHLLSFSPPHVRVFAVLHSSTVVLLPFVAAPCRRSAAGPYHPPVLTACLSSCMSIWIQTMKMPSLPKPAYV